jgi:hypothetical protein
LAFFIVGRVNDFLKGRGFASEKWQMKNVKSEMINDPVATARGSDTDSKVLGYFSHCPLRGPEPFLLFGQKLVEDLP